MPARLDSALLDRARAHLAAFERRALPDDGRRRAAVAEVLLPDEEGRACFLITRRAATLRRHTGQWALPGGRVDTGETAERAALRELQEEVGLTLDESTVLGVLDDYGTRSGFIITPVVALVQPDCVLTPNPYEVADVFEVPLAFLLDPANHRRHVFDLDGVHREWFSMPFQDQAQGKTHFIWGATAGILRNFYRFMKA